MELMKALVSEEQSKRKGIQIKDGSLHFNNIYFFTWTGIDSFLPDFTKGLLAHCNTGDAKLYRMTRWDHLQRDMHLDYMTYYYIVSPAMTIVLLKTTRTCRNNVLWHYSTFFLTSGILVRGHKMDLSCFNYLFIMHRDRYFAASFHPSYSSTL